MTAALRLTLRTCSKYSVGHMLKFWHRTAGLFAAVFLLLLTVTGLLLMQTDDLELDSRVIDSDRLLDWYGIRPAPPPLSFSADDRWITQLGSRLYFDAQFLLSVDGQLIGVVSAGDETLVATTKMLVLLTAAGEIAEKLDAAAGVPPGLAHVGTTDDETIVLRSQDAQFVFEPSSGRLTATKIERPIRWSSAEAIPPVMLQAINHGYRGQGLSLERVILDLHTGRLFGAAGVALINLASILLLVLIFSGVILWWTRARNGSNGSGD